MLNFPVIKKSTIKLSGSRVLIVVLALKSYCPVLGELPPSPFTWANKDSYVWQ